MRDVERTRASIDYPGLAVALRRAVFERADGRIACPERTLVPLRASGTMLSMPAAGGDIAIHKLITVMPDNARTGLPVIQGTMSIIDVHTGRLLAVLDGPTVTGRRTAAMSMLAIETFAAKSPRRILVIGTGSQARHHVDAIDALFPDAAIRVRGRTIASSEAFCHGNRDASRAIAPDEGEDCDVVITCTTSTVPVYAQAARDDRLVIATGSFRPTIAEIDAATVRSSALFVDDLDGARHEAGDLLLAGIGWNDVVPLSDVLREKAVRSTRPVLFKSVGCAAWDLAAARVALQNDPPD